MNTQYVGNIFGAVETGHVLVFAGKTIDGAVSLVIDLSAGKEEDADIALRLEVLFHDEMVVRNSLLGGEWGPEERDENRKEFTLSNPLVPGEYFKVYIFVSEQHFHIALNDEAYCTYAHRCPLSVIRTCVVNRDLQAITHVDHRSVFPAPMPVMAFEEPKLEFSNDIPRRFEAGHVMIITGIPYGNNIGMFTVCFTEGVAKKQALHFNVRFEPENVVVRNSMNDSLEFIREERDGVLPFFIDEQFKLAIAFGAHEFKFAVNGNPFGKFDYRSAQQLTKLNGLKIMAARGMHLEITGVDHVQTGEPDCGDWQTFSHPDVQIF